MRAEAKALVDTLMSLARLERPLPAALEGVLGTKFVSSDYYGSYAEPTPAFCEIELRVPEVGGPFLVATLAAGNSLSARELLWDDPLGPNIRRLSQPGLDSDFLSYRAGNV